MTTSIFPILQYEQTKVQVFTRLKLQRLWKGIKNLIRGSDPVSAEVGQVLNWSHLHSVSETIDWPSVP